MRRDGGTTLTSLTKASAIARRRFSLLLPFGYACSPDETPSAVCFNLTTLLLLFNLPRERQSMSMSANCPGGCTSPAGSASA